MIIHCKYDELVSIKKLKSHPKNRNKHPVDQVERLAAILIYQGWRYPVKVSNQSGFVTSGHGRIEAAKLNGWELIPVNYQDYENDEQEYADVTADNAIASWSELDLSAINADLPDLGPDFEIDLLGIKDFILEPADRDQGDPDETPEVKDGPSICQPGELWTLGEHRLLCGDSTDEEHIDRLMGGENELRADLLFTDPPYGINAVSGNQVTAGTIIKGKLAKAGSYKAVAGDEDTDVAKKTYEIISGIKKQVIWGGNYFTDFLPVNGHWLVWSKKGYEKDDTFSDAELAWTNIPQVSVKLYSHIWDGMWREGNRSEELKKRVHPTQKPVGLLSKIIEDYSIDGELILDLFLGSGSTLIACEKTHRKCFGMEIDPHYCDVILERFHKYSGKEPIREDKAKWLDLKSK